MSRRVGNITSLKALFIYVSVDQYRPRVGEVLHVSDKKGSKLFVQGYTSEFEIICLNVLDNQNLIRGDIVMSDGQDLQLPVDKAVFGRVFNALGQTIDGNPDLKESTLTTSVNVVNNTDVAAVHKPEVLETGIKVIDFLAPFVKGRRIGIIGGAGVGKTVLTTEIMHNVADKKTALTFFVGIGERIREGHELYHTLSDRGLSDNTIMYMGQMNENAAMRSMVGPSAAAVARYFCDQKNDVLFFVDNIYRFVQAHNELATMQGGIPSEGGYQPGLFSELHRFEDSLHSSKNGTITSVQSIYIPADDLSDPAVTEISLQLDSVIVLSRAQFERGIFPAVDLLETTSSLLTPEIIGKRHYELVRRVKAIMRKYYSLQAIIAIVGESELAPDDRLDYSRAKALIAYFNQSMFVTEVLSGVPGEYFEREATLKGIEEILAR